MEIAAAEDAEAHGEAVVVVGLDNGAAGGAQRGEVGCDGEAVAVLVFVDLLAEATQLRDYSDEIQDEDIEV